MCPSLPDCCQEAAITWKIGKLIDDLEAKHRLLKPRGKGLDDWEKQYLCLLLADKKPDRIAEIIGFNSVEYLKVRLSNKKGGLYSCIARLTGKRIENWRDPIIFLLNKGYRRNQEVPIETMLMVVLDIEVSEENLRKLEFNIKNVVGANKVRIKRIEKGSLVVYLEGSRLACGQIEALFKQGVLSERLGFPVLDVQFAPIRVNLSRWFQGMFEMGWQQVEELLTPQQLSRVWGENLERAKRINLRADLLSHAIILLVNLTQENEETVIIQLKAYPTDEDSYLPENLKLQVLVDEEEVFQEVAARSADEWMQVQFDADRGDEFKVRLMLGEIQVTESFVI